jgi:hypothetical protein
MGDLWPDEGFGSGSGLEGLEAENDWDEGEESLETDVEDAFDDPEEADGDEGSWEDADA